MPEDSLEKLDASIRSQSMVAASAEIEILDNLILHINHGTAMLSGTKHDRGLSLLLGIFLNRAFNSLWRAREDAVTGYTAESLTLCRAALEHWTAASWVELNPDTTDRWLWAIVEEVDQPEEWPPTTNEMLKDLGELGEAPVELYDMLSKYAHPKGLGLRSLIHFDTESTYFHAGGHFDEGSLKLCLYFLIGVAQACLEPVARLQSRMLSEADPGWLADGLKLSEPAAELLRLTERTAIDAAAKLPDAGAENDNG